jgi:lysophospholipase L1-like esterase
MRIQSDKDRLEPVRSDLTSRAWRRRRRSARSGASLASLCLAAGLASGCAPAMAARTPDRVADLSGDGRMVVACLGDSNTDPVFNGRLAGGGWCERLGAGRGDHAEVRNFGAGGGTLACAFPFDVSLAAHQLDEALAVDADALVLAFITNDIRYAVDGTCESLDPKRRATGRPIGAAEIDREFSRRLRALVREAKDRHFWVLLAPPALPPEGDAINAEIATLNDLLQRRYASSRRVTIIEHPALEPADYADSLHMSASGQRKRAAAVRAALFGR